VLLDPTTADPLYRRSVRVSLGHVLRVPWARLPGLPDGLAVVREHGLALVALTPAPDAEPIDALGTEPGPIALLLGAEGPGLTPATLAAADRRARIPLAPGVDSLNVATAAAIAFHHLAQQPGGLGRR
jgi:tRNA G18 (ribose-2'-O)-methylase SpoU